MIDRRFVLASLLAVSLAPLRAHAESTEVLDTVVDGLDRPWSFAFLPDGTILVTEKAGALRSIGADRKLSEPIAGLPEVAAVGQGGLLDIALHPNFEQTRLVFLSFAEPREDGKNATSVMRGRLSEDFRSLTDVKVIFRQQPAYDGGGHFGSRLAFADEKAVMAEIKKLYGDKPLGEGKIKLDVPEIAENGLVLPLSLYISASCLM